LEKALVVAEEARDARFAVVRLSQLPLCLRVHLLEVIANAVCKTLLGRPIVKRLASERPSVGTQDVPQQPLLHNFQLRPCREYRLGAVGANEVAVDGQGCERLS